MDYGVSLASNIIGIRGGAMIRTLRYATSGHHYRKLFKTAVTVRASVRYKRFSCVHQMLAGEDLWTALWFGRS